MLEIALDAITLVAQDGLDEIKKVHRGKEPDLVAVFRDLQKVQNLCRLIKDAKKENQK